MQRRRIDKDEYVIPLFGLKSLHSFDMLSINNDLNWETFDRAKDVEDDEHTSFSTPYPLLSNNVSLSGMLDYLFYIISLALCNVQR